MNRNLWIDKSLNEYFPCPHCGRGVLDIKELKEYQTPLSKREDEEFMDACIGPYPYMQYYNFWAILYCLKCNEPVICSGESFWSQRFEGEEDAPNKKEVLKPKSFIPPLKIIEIPLNTPDKLKQEIHNSFELFWMNESACANSIRKVLEFFMDEENVPRYSSNNKEIWLGNRIKQYDKIDNKLLEAVKEIGNAGSHQSTTVNHVLDGFDLLEYVLELVYSNKHDGYVKLAESIIQKLKRS